MHFGISPSVLIYNHIYKCAGTTFESLLEQQFGSDYHYAGFLSSWPSLQRSLQKQQRQTLAIAGHAAWGTHELLPASYNAFYITILREPFSRFMSTYRFSRSRGALYATPSECLTEFPHNFLVKWLGNGDPHLAKVRLLSVYSLFGLVERFNEFLVMLTDLTGTQFSSYTIRNRTEDTRPVDSLGLREEFERLNGDDLELYRWASQVFEERWRSRLDRAPRPTLIAASEPVGSAEPFGEELSRSVAHGNLAEAIRIMECAGAPTPSHCYYLARIHERLNHFEAALHWFTEATQRDVENALSLAWFLDQHGLFGRAIEVLTQALSTLGSISVTSADAYPSRFRQKAYAHLERLHSEISRSRKCVIAPATATVEVDVHEELVRTWQFSAAYVLARLETLDAVHGSNATIALFGNGKHTNWLLTVVASTPWRNRIMCILDDNAVPGLANQGIPVVHPTRPGGYTWSILIPSSDTCEQQLIARIHELFDVATPVWLLYGGRISGAIPKPPPTHEAS